MSLTRIVVNTPDSATSVANHLNPQATSKMQSKLNLANWLQGMSMGTYPDATEVELNTGAVKATGTGTFTGLPTADQVMVIAGVSFTAKASGATGNQYNIGADAPATAANLVTAVNASASLTGILTASNLLGVVTFTAAVPGAIGNAIATVDTDTANFTFAQAALTGGANGTKVVF